MNIKAQIPNFFTMLNLFCGCLAIVCITSRSYTEAFLLVSLGIFFDFFDGFFARKFGVAGPLGVQLDSLADMVTSGVAPGFVMFAMLDSVQFHAFHPICDYEIFDGLPLVPCLGFIITLGACYRLAKFNIDTRQSDSFIGLPTPANSLFFMSLPVILEGSKAEWMMSVFSNQWILITMVLLSAYVMNAEIPLFSLKIKNFSFAKYKLQVFFLIISVVMLVFLQILAVPLIILFYVLLSVFNNIANKKASV